MSVQGILVIDLVGIVLAAAIVNLVRTHRLHVGFGVLWLGTVAVVMVLVSIPPLLALVTQLVGAVFPVSALTLLAFVFIFAVLVFFSVRLSSLSSQQAELVQALALKELLAREEAARASGNMTEHGDAGETEAGDPGR